MNEGEFQSLPKFGRVNQEHQYLEEIARLTAELAEAKNDSPGTPLGRFKFMTEWAYSQPWANAHLSVGWESQLIAHMEAQAAELAASQERERVLRGLLKLTRDTSVSHEFRERIDALGEP